MEKKLLSDKEQLNLHKSIRKKIDKILDELNKPKVSEKQNKFIEKFIICELSYKMVLKKYLKENKESKSKNKMKIYISQVKDVLDFANYSFVGENFLDKLFRTTGDYKKRGTKSARVLRNGIEHSLNINDLEEVNNRYDELIKLMDNFIEILQK